MNQSALLPMLGDFARSARAGVIRDYRDECLFAGSHPLDAERFNIINDAGFPLASNTFFPTHSIPDRDLATLIEHDDHWNRSDLRRSHLGVKLIGCGVSVSHAHDLRTFGSTGPVVAVCQMEMSTGDGPVIQNVHTTFDNNAKAAFFANICRCVGMQSLSPRLSQKSNKSSFIIGAAAINSASSFHDSRNGLIDAISLSFGHTTKHRGPPLASGIHRHFSALAHIGADDSVSRLWDIHVEPRPGTAIRHPILVRIRFNHIVSGIAPDGRLSGQAR